MRGSIEKRGKGYRVTIFLGASEDGKPQRYRETVSTKKAAEAVLRTRLEEFETENVISKRTAETLQAYLRTWLTTIKARKVSLKTLQAYLQVVDHDLQGTPLGKTPMKLVTVEAIEEHLKAMLDRPALGPAHKLKGLIAGAFKRAVKTKDINHSPCVYLDPLPPLRPVGKPPLPLESFDAFVSSALQEPRLGSLWVLLLATGARPEEVLGLKWTDLENGNIHIQRALIWLYRWEEGESPWILGCTKTKGSKRTVNVSSEVVFLLRQHRAQQNEERLLAGEAYAGHDFVFATELGEPLTDHRTRTAFHRIVERAGLPARTYSPYSLRSGLATGLLRQGKELAVVSKILGHSSLTTTSDSYFHISPDLREGAADTMAAAMFGKRA